MNRTAKRNTNGGLYMRLTNLKLLKSLMNAQHVSQRELATAAGYKSHTYLGRLLRGQVSTLEAKPAVRIAWYLGVDLGDLFVTHVSSATARNVERKAA